MSLGVYELTVLMFNFSLCICWTYWLQLSKHSLNRCWLERWIIKTIALMFLNSDNMIKLERKGYLQALGLDRISSFRDQQDVVDLSRSPLMRWISCYGRLSFCMMNWTLMVTQASDFIKSQILISNTFLIL